MPLQSPKVRKIPTLNLCDITSLASFTKEELSRLQQKNNSFRKWLELKEFLIDHTLHQIVFKKCILLRGSIDLSTIDHQVQGLNNYVPKFAKQISVLR